MLTADPNFDIKQRERAREREREKERERERHTHTHTYTGTKGDVQKSNITVVLSCTKLTLFIHKKISKSFGYIYIYIWMSHHLVR